MNYWGDLDLDDVDLDVEVCLQCGRYYGTHAGLRAWDRALDGSRLNGGVAPQLCAKCWRDCGYRWPAPPA